MSNEENRSRGCLHIEPLFNAVELGIIVPEPHPDRALQIFLDAASDPGNIAIASRVSQMPKGVLLLQTVEGQAACGAIYIYVRATGQFYAVWFDGDSDNLTVTEYEDLVPEYGLLEYAADPGLILTLEAKGHA